MAAYEDYGYCPFNAFCNYGDATSRSKQEQYASDLLGVYSYWMVYQPHQCMPASYGNGDDWWCTIVDATIGGGDSFLGIEIACHLRAINPNPKDVERKIAIRDTYDIAQYYAIGHYNHNGVDGFSFYDNGIIDLNKPKIAEESAYLFFDSRYVVIIDNGIEENGDDILITIQKR